MLHRSKMPLPNLGRHFPSALGGDWRWGGCRFRCPRSSLPSRESSLDLASGGVFWASDSAAFVTLGSVSVSLCLMLPEVECCVSYSHEIPCFSACCAVNAVTFSKFRSSPRLVNLYRETYYHPGVRCLDP